MDAYDSIVIIINSTFNENSVQGGGGAVFAEDCSFSIRSSTFTNSNAVYASAIYSIASSMDISAAFSL